MVDMDKAMAQVTSAPFPARSSQSNADPCQGIPAVCDDLDASASATIAPLLLPPGTPLQQWLSRLHVMVLFEQALPNTLSSCFALHVPAVVLVVNADYTEPAEVAAFAQWSALHVWSKTPRTHSAMSAAVALNLSSSSSSSSSSFPSRHHLITWSIPDPVATSHVPLRQGQPLQVLMIAGTGGVNYRRGMPNIITGFLH
jgi:hypothetical protein